MIPCHGIRVPHETTGVLVDGAPESPQRAHRADVPGRYHLAGRLRVISRVLQCLSRVPGTAMESRAKDIDQSPVGLHFRLSDAYVLLGSDDIDVSQTLLVANGTAAMDEGDPALRANH